MRLLWRSLLVAFYLFLLIGVSGKLFFEKQFDAFIGGLIPTGQGEIAHLTIGYAEPLVSLSPLANDVGSRSRLLHLYEPLLRQTPDLALEPALALSYGALNPTTWELRLRPDVFFHDGSPLTVEEVVGSIKAAQTDPSSGLSDLLSSLSDVRATDEETLILTTTEADPLLPHKLSSVLIFHTTSAGATEGTGPYLLTANSSDRLELKRFDDYWDRPPAVVSATLKTLSTKVSKEQALGEASVDILANIPADLASEFAVPGYTLKTRPSLEVNALIFNVSGAFSQPELREVVRRGVDVQTLSRLGHGFAEVASQFVGDGVYGYNPALKAPGYNASLAQSVLEGAELPEQPIILDLPRGLETLGTVVQKQLAAVGLAVEPRYNTSAELGSRILAGTSDFYFFGWRSDLGDAADFLTAVAHSKEGSLGQFNGGGYSNPQVDALIEASQSTLNQAERLDILRHAMELITETDPLGLPLFSPEVLYALRDGINWNPRVDGVVLAQEVRF
ncbi:hypothetical protein CO046_05335 [Candidatus Peregrinibacteria bacterium CG_4_9_14_0_2_um_filter_53_11]|nr:MAG: hypothetical protein CO046_05335 [Candidatus Peregrinibacteria bacterium CG_4_9_14_0_2_um_filter_53_11]